jgi:hypothetical protein
MEPIEKVFSVDADLQSTTLMKLLKSSGILFSQAPGRIAPLGQLGKTKIFQFSSVRTSALPSLNSTRQPHTYTKFLINDKIMAESSIVKDNIRPDWSMDNITLDLSDAQRFLRCVIVFKNYIFEDVEFGHVDIPLISLDVLNGKEQSFLIDTSSEVAQAALETMIANGGNPPKLYITAISL